MKIQAGFFLTISLQKYQDKIVFRWLQLWSQSLKLCIIFFPLIRCFFHKIWTSYDYGMVNIIKQIFLCSGSRFISLSFISSSLFYDFMLRIKPQENLLQTRYVMHMPRKICEFFLLLLLSLSIFYLLEIG